MRKLSVLLLLVLAPLWLVPGRLAAQEPAGKAAFLENKCNMCHTIESQGIEKTSKMVAPDLSDAGNMVESAEWLKGFFLKENAAKDGKKHSKTWSGTDEQMKAIIDWVMTLKKT
ncbi:MAG: c-type cytochrome [Vicinamibacteria bacterium]